MSLLSYEEAAPWARAIKVKVLAREMPPWPADPRYGRFRNEQTLTDAQIDTIVAWVDAGAPRGDGAPPRPPKFLDGWSTQMNRPPDQVIDAPFEFALPASGEIPAFSVWMKPLFHDERFIEAIELRPTNRALVHHASALLAKLPEGAAALGRGPLWPGGPIFDGVPVLRDGTPAPPPPVPELLGKPLVFYVPAGGFLRFPRGVAKRIQPDEYLMWNFHFVPAGSVQRIGMRMGLWFSRSEVQHEALTWTVTERMLFNETEVHGDAVGRRPLPKIAAGDARYTVTGVMRVTEDLTLYALWPHMHLRGRDMTFILVDPEGREQPLLSVPKYKFDWQFTYELATPLKIRAGSTIKAVAHYDNSSTNPNNPDPSQDVVWGPQTTNEMFGPYLEIVFDKRTLQPGPGAARPCDSFRPPPDPNDQQNGGLFPPCR